MNKDEKLCRIDIPSARKQILQSIAEYRMRDKIVAIITEFFVALDPAKRVDKRVAERLHLKLLEDNTLPVTHVFYTAKANVFGAPEWTFDVRVFGLPDTKFFLRFAAQEVGKLPYFDIDNMLVSHCSWGAHADFLEGQLPRFAFNAGKFNDMLDALAGLCMFAQPPGDAYPVYPLSDHFHWYQLHDLNVRKG